MATTRHRDPVAHRRYHATATGILGETATDTDVGIGRGCREAAHSSRARDRESRRSCPTRSRPRTRAARSASRTARSRTPRCRRACRPALPRACSGTHVRGGAENHAGLRRRRGHASATCVTSGDDPPSASSALARPKSSTLTVPSGVILTLAGFRSRWTMPLLVRGLERVGDLPRDRRAPRRAGIGALRRSGRRASRPRPAPARAPSMPSDSLEAVDRRDVRMIQRGERPAPRAGIAPAARRQLRSVRQDLDRDVAIQLRVAGAIDLAHAAHADLRGELHTGRGVCQEAGSSGAGPIIEGGPGQRRVRICANRVGAGVR